MEFLNKDARLSCVIFAPFPYKEKIEKDTEKILLKT